MDNIVYKKQMKNLSRKGGKIGLGHTGKLRFFYECDNLIFSRTPLVKQCLKLSQLLNDKYIQPC